MLYVFNNSQKLLKAYGDDAFIEMHLEEAINSADELTFSLPKELKLPDDAMYVAVPYPNQIEKYSFLMLGDVFNKAETVEYQASEMAYTELATYKYIKDVRPQKRTPEELVNIAISGTPWSLAKCNVDGSYSTNFYYISPFEALQKILELAKGEISFYVTIEGNKITGRYIEYLNQQGSDNGYRFEYGNNLVDVSKEANLGTIYTAIVPRGKGELIEDENPDTPDGYGRRITIANVAWSKSKGNPLDKPLKSEVLIDPNAKAKFGQLDGTNRYLVEVFEDIEEPEQLIKAAYRRLNEINHIQVEYQAQVVDGHQLNLGDTVVVKRNDNRDLDFKTRVFKIKYDLLSPKNAQLSLGDNMSGQSLESKIKSISSSSSSANDKSLWAMQNGDGTRTFYSDKKPVSAKEGDLWFKELPNGDVEVYRYEKGEWVLVLDPATGECIQNEVNDALQKAKEYSEQLNQKTNENIGELEKTVNSGLAEIQPKIDKAKQDAIDTSQQKVDALNQQVNKDLQTVQPRIDKAKQDAIDTSQQKVDALNQQVNKDLQTVQPRIDKAKQEAMQDASQKISKVEIKTDSITSIVNNPSTGLSATKVQLDAAIQQEIKDRKTGDTNTLTQGKDFTTSQITNSEKGLKSTINQTADGIMANVGRQNLVIDSSLTESIKWWTTTNFRGSKGSAKDWYYSPATRYKSIPSIGINNTGEGNKYAFITSQPIDVRVITTIYANVDIFVRSMGTTSNDHLIVYVLFVDKNGNQVGDYSGGSLAGEITKPQPWTSYTKSFTVPSGAVNAYIQYQLRGDANAYIARPYIGFGPLDVGNYIPGPVSNSNTTLALFDDRITSTVTGLEGKISNVTQKADSLTSIVNNPTTGLSATRTQLDSAIQQEIKDRKSGDTNTLTQGKDFTTSQITNSEKGLKSTINQTADGIMANVGRQNLVIDSSLTESIKWWTTTNFRGSKGSAKDWYYSPATRYKSIPSIGINNTGEGNKYAFITSQPIDVRVITTIYANVDIFVRSMGTTSNDHLIVYVLFVDKNGNQVGDYSGGSLAGEITKPQPWTSYTKSFTVPSGAVNAYIQYQLRGDANAYIARPYIGFGPLDVGNYIPGPVSNSNTTLALFDDRITSTVTGLEGKISNVTQKADSLTSIVNNPTTGLSATRTQLDSAIQQEIKDRKSGDTNTLTQSKDFTTSQIKSSESGLKSTISQTADGIMLDVSKANLVIDSSLTESLKWWTPESANGISSSKKFYYTMLTAYKNVPSVGINMMADTNMNIAALNSQIVSIPAGCKKLYAKANIFVNKIGTDGALGFVVGWYDKNKTYISYDTVSDTIKKVMPWTEFGRVVDVPENAKFVSISYTAAGVINAYISRPYLGITPLSDGAYIPGPVSNTDTFLSLFNENFGLGIKDNVGSIISGINGDTSGLAITGKKVSINGDTTVNGDFWTKNVNAVKVDASNITAGTIDANKVNLVHLNANQITTGTLQGININVNKTLEIATGGLIKWNTDAVIRGYSDNPFYWQGVGDGKFSVVNITEKGSVKMDTKSLITLEGQLKAPENTSKKYLGKMWTHSTGPASNSAFGRNRISSTGIELQIYENKPLDGVDVSYVTSINANGINMGTAYVRPRISLSASSGTISGRRVRLGSDVASPYNFDNQMILSYFGRDGNTPPRFQIESYDGNTPTVSYSANMYMASTGAIFKTSSKRAKKTNIQHDFTLEQANALVDLQPATWHDKAELERTDDAPLVPVRHFGMVAEELAQAGLSQLVEYDEYGNVMSISYDRLAIALIPAIKSLRERVGELEYKLTKTKEN